VSRSSSPVIKRPKSAGAIQVRNLSRSDSAISITSPRHNPTTTVVETDDDMTGQSDSDDDDQEMKIIKRYKVLIPSDRIKPAGAVSTPSPGTPKRPLSAGPARKPFSARNKVLSGIGAAHSTLKLGSLS
jgi:hypothetical protein